MNYKHKRSKATGISDATKTAVIKRDEGRCIFCGSPGRPEAHFISRAHGGLGIEQNIITVCRWCHDKMDQSVHRRIYLEVAEKYLKTKYDDWDVNSLIYGGEK